MKKSLCVLIGLLMAFSALNTGITAFAEMGYQTVDDDYIENRIDAGEGIIAKNADAFSAEIVKYSGAAENLVIPETVDGKSVVSIGSFCFRNNKKIKSVTLPKTVKVINEGAFCGCSRLESINLENVEKINYRAFTNDVRLKAVNLKSTKFIGRLAFKGCAELTQITNLLPDRISEKAFFKTALYNDAINNNKKALYINKNLICAFTDKIKGSFKVKKGTVLIADLAFRRSKPKTKSKLTKIYLPNSVKRLGLLSLNCNTVKSIRLPKGLNSIGVNAISEKYIKKNAVNKNGCYYLKTYLVKCDNKSAVKIRKGTTLVADGVLCKCNMKKLVFPAGVKFIGEGNFKSKKLVSVSFPASLREIASENFTSDSPYFVRGCNKLKRITVSDKNKRFSSKNGVLYNKNRTELIAYPAGKTDVSFTVPDSVKRINRFAFANAKNLKEIKLNSGIKAIEAYAFANCIFTSVTIPESVSYIGRCAFGFTYNYSEDEQGYFINQYFTVKGKEGSAAQKYCTDRVVALNYDDSWNYISTPVNFVAI